jgi:nitroimidazol reductase NimA-like FMN-containing flavoprotein (pyridoxamine 5'-phosphate oxidase superfamily)
MTMTPSVQGASSDAWLETLSDDECWLLLRTNTFGRIAFDLDGSPSILPINYRLIETSGRTWLAVRTRPGNVIDQAPILVAFEIDGIDTVRKQGWSVIVRGTLHHVDPDAAAVGERFDPAPWIEAERDSWLIVEPFAVSGRRLHPAVSEWAFQPTAYL